MRTFTPLLVLTAAATTVHSNPVVQVETGTNYRATFEEADAPNLEPSPGIQNENVTYQSLNWSNTNLAIQKPAGTATTYFLIPQSPEQYGQMPPVFTENEDLSRTYSPPNGVIRPAKPNQKVQLQGFYFGCSRPGPIPGYSNNPVNCSLEVTGTGGVGEEGYFAYPDYTPIIGDCQQLGSEAITGGGCAGLAYVGADQLVGLSNYGPYGSITFTLPAYSNDEANRTSIFVDEVSYTVEDVEV